MSDDERMLKFAAELTALCKRYGVRLDAESWAGSDPELVTKSLDASLPGQYAVNGDTLASYTAPASWLLSRWQVDDTQEFGGLFKPVATGLASLDAAKARATETDPDITWESDHRTFFYLEDGVTRETLPPQVWGRVGGKRVWVIDGSPPEPSE